MSTDFSSSIKAMPEFRSNEVRKSILKWLEPVRQWTPKWKTGIYPFEMAVFLGVCDVMKIKTVIDSGRGPDAYSTLVLGEFSELNGISVYSFDLTPIEKKHYRESLNRFQKITFLTGDVFVQLPGVLRESQGPVALLVDGPKKEDANRLSLIASSVFDIRIVAHHNCPPAAAWTHQFKKAFNGATTVEDFNMNDFPEWQSFRTWEQQVTGNYSVDSMEKGVAIGRTLQASSLMMGLAEGYQGRKDLVWKAGLKGWLLHRRWQRCLRKS